MAGIPPVVAVEIGTCKTVALVGEMREDGSVMITGTGEHTTTGVRKGEVTDIEGAAAGVRAALEQAETSGNVIISQVHVALSGGHIQSLSNRGNVPVLDKEGIVTEEDVEDVKEVAQAVNLPADRVILHSIYQHFWIDEQTAVVRPVGLEGARLSLDMLLLHAVRPRINNTLRVFAAIPVDVQDVAFSGLCSALSVLTPEQKQAGALVIDMGGGTTDYIAYAGGVVAAGGALGVGGEHVTNDIALGLTLPHPRAEALKRNAGSAIVESGVPDSRLVLPAELGFQERTVSVRALSTIIQARVSEILETVRKRCEVDDILHRVGAGVVLTGGGANLKSVLALAERVFDLPASLGKPRSVGGLSAATGKPEYATCSGLIQLGFRSMEGEKPRKALDWLTGWLGR